MGKRSIVVALAPSDDGASPVRLVREARGLPEPSVSAGVRGRGRSRVLSWHERHIPGQRVTFAEIGKDVRNAITTTGAVRGSVRFKPADGPAGRRRIVALVQQNGVPRTTLTFRLSDGRRLVKVVGANRRRLVLKGVPRRVSARIKVIGLGHANGKGPVARVSVKRRTSRPR